MAYIFYIPRTINKLLLLIVLVAPFIIFLSIIKQSKEEYGDDFQTNYLQNSVVGQVKSDSRIRVQEDNVKLISESVIDKYYNVWCIFTKVKRSNSYFKIKFNNMIKSVLNHSTVGLSFNIITDPRSQVVAQSVFKYISRSTMDSKRFKVIYHDVGSFVSQLSDLKFLSPYFTSRQRDYYNDPLFFLSLGLHRVAPSNQSRAVLLDLDLQFVADIAELFKEFDKFKKHTVVGIGPELSPWYGIALAKYRSLHKDTRFGRPLAVGGFQGVNSGVTLLHLDRIRASREFQQLLTPTAIRELTEQYRLQGRLGDQDLYTLIGMSRPHLLHQLSCGWNYQLCYPYTHPNYSLDTFDDVYAYCGQPIKVYHGNCKAPLPSV